MRWLEFFIRSKEIPWKTYPTIASKARRQMFGCTPVGAKKTQQRPVPRWTLLLVNFNTSAAYEKGLALCKSLPAQYPSPVTKGTWHWQTDSPSPFLYGERRDAILCNIPHCLRSVLYFDTVTNERYNTKLSKLSSSSLKGPIGYHQDGHWSLGTFQHSGRLEYVTLTICHPQPHKKGLIE